MANEIIRKMLSINCQQISYSEAHVVLRAAWRLQSITDLTNVACRKRANGGYIWFSQDNNTNLAWPKTRVELGKTTLILQQDLAYIMILKRS